MAVGRTWASSCGVGNGDCQLREVTGALRDGGEGEARRRRTLGPRKRSNCKVLVILQSVEERVCWRAE
ncbi:hypothetical protein LINPERHAP2_LOCUS20921 [Linum perenne]